MSPLALGMDILLAALLAAALFIGARLNNRLAALRSGQAGFARAVDDLNAAAARADSALKALRSASEETHDALLTRIETARGLILRLEEACAAADRVQRRPEPAVTSRLTGLLDAVGRAGVDDLHAPQRSSAPPRAGDRGTLGGLGAHAAQGQQTPHDLSARSSLERPPLRRTLSELLAARGRTPPEPAQRQAPPPRRRPAQDEDLFVDFETGADDADAAFGRRL